MSEAKQHNTTSNPPPSRGLFARLLQLAGGMTIGLVVGVGINSYMGYKLGYAPMMKALHHTLSEQLAGLGFRDKPLAEESGWVMKQIATQVVRWEQAGEQVVTKRVPTQPSTLTHWVALANRGLSLIGLTLALMAAKLLSVSISLLVLVFAALIGAMDGLLKRYIRTQEGGRESTFVFHRISDVLITAPVLLLVIYLALPIYLPPQAVVMAMSGLVFLFFTIATTNLKKFL